MVSKTRKIYGSADIGGFIQAGAEMGKSVEISG